VHGPRAACNARRACPGREHAAGAGQRVRGRQRGAAPHRVNHDQDFLDKVVRLAENPGLAARAVKGRRILIEAGWEISDNAAIACALPAFLRRASRAGKAPRPLLIPYA